MKRTILIAALTTVTLVAGCPGGDNPGGTGGTGNTGGAAGGTGGGGTAGAGGRGGQAGGTTGGTGGSRPADARRDTPASRQDTAVRRDTAPGSDRGTTAGGACGTAACTSAQVCCNASCGLCTPPGGTCVQVVCGACTVDSDCRLFDDYCTGCDCRALAKNDPNPTCNGVGVQCIQQPCGFKVAQCQSGRCVLRAVPLRAPR